MRKIICLLILVTVVCHSGIAQLTTEESGGNKKAIVFERIGLTDVTINYRRPGVKGREGKVWGTLVPYGFNDLGFGTSKAAPWRAGANQNTTIEFSNDVKVNGKLLPAGKYGFFIALGKEESILIFSKNSSAWGSYFYDEKDDALRITIQPKPLDQLVEWLKFDFEDQTDNSATVALKWEKLMFPFKVEVDVKKAQVESFRRELKTNTGFDSKEWAQAAEWCVANDTNFVEGLEWAEYAVNGRFIGEKNFRNLTAKAMLLSKLNRENEADVVMKEALPLGTMNEVHNYARQLVAAKRLKEAAEVFNNNYKKYPNMYTTNVGMARLFSSQAKFKEAIKYAVAGVKTAPDEPTKVYTEGLLEKLKANKDIN